MDSSTPFKWLDMLEQEFDRNFAFVDVLLDDAEFDDTYSADGGSLSQIRQRMSYISGAFGQLVHKSLTIFQSNLKLEARVLVAEEDAARTEARCKTLADEVRALRAQLAAVSSQNPQKSASILIEQVVPDPQIVQILEEDAQRRMLATFRSQLANSQYGRLKQENEDLKKEALQARSEIEALRLTLRYLDKERAGRIQQIQLLSNPKMGMDERNRVWSQLETEIALQRCKTVVQTCLVRQQKSAAPLSPPNSAEKEPRKLATELVVGETRTITYERPNEGGALGLSVVGGRDVALPIIISSVSPLSPLAGQVVIGDLVRSANGFDLSVASRQEAVEAIISPPEKAVGDKLEMVVCYLGGADDGSYDDQLIASGSLYSSPQNEKTGVENTDSQHEQQYETVWLQNGELWPAINSGVTSSANEAASNICQESGVNRIDLPPLLLTDNPPEVVINEKVLQASFSSSSVILSNALFNASGRAGSGGAFVTLKTGIQPREDEVVEDVVASFSVDLQNTNNNNSSNNDPDDSETQRIDFSNSLIAFSADM